MDKPWPVDYIQEYTEMYLFVHRSIKVLRQILEDEPELLAVVERSKPDHIGIRVATIEEYICKKNELKQANQLISEAIIPMNSVSGRPIAIFKLRRPIHTVYGDVEYFELPAPRKGVVEQNKFDHIELVLPEDVTLADLVSMYGDVFCKLDMCTTDDLLATIELIVNGNSNPDLTIVFGKYKIKFHERDIGRVVEREEAELAILQELGEAYDILNPGVRG